MKHWKTYRCPECGTCQTIEVEDGYKTLCVCPNCGITYNFLV